MLSDNKGITEIDGKGMKWEESRKEGATCKLLLTSAFFKELLCLLFRSGGNCNEESQMPCLILNACFAGKDDLRQDAVMQQVFGLLNSLLKRRESDTAKRSTTRDPCRFVRSHKPSKLDQTCDVPCMPM